MLLYKIISIINKKTDSIKKLIYPKTDTNDIELINKFLHKYYDKHTFLTESNNDKVEKDKSPLITTISDKEVNIKLFSINDTYYDMIYHKTNKLKYNNYKTNTKIGLRTIKNIKKVSDAIKNNTIINLDLTECGGGDLHCFIDMIYYILGRGLYFYTFIGMNKKPLYLEYKGKNLNWKSKSNMITKKFIIPDNYKINILISENTASSAEYIIMLIKSFRSNVKIIRKSGKKTAGYLNMTKDTKFDNKYFLNYTIASNIYDINGKKWKQYI